jgi:hypothetical protein
MSKRAAGLTNGLAVSDDQPLDYFYRYARYHFDALADLEEAEQRGTPNIELEYLRYFAYAWKEMARSQSNKYRPIIEKNAGGKEVLARLGLTRSLIIPPRPKVS